MRKLISFEGTIITFHYPLSIILIPLAIPSLIIKFLFSKIIKGIIFLIGYIGHHSYNLGKKKFD